MAIVQGHQLHAATGEHEGSLNAFQGACVGADRRRGERWQDGPKGTHNHGRRAAAERAGTDRGDAGRVVDLQGVVGTRGAEGLRRIGDVHLEDAVFAAGETLQRAVEGAAGAGVEVEVVAAVVGLDVAEVFGVVDGTVGLQLEEAVAEVQHAAIVETVVVVGARVVGIGRAVEQGERSPAGEGDRAGSGQAAVRAGEREVGVLGRGRRRATGGEAVGDPAVGRLLDEDVAVEAGAVVGNDAHLARAAHGEAGAVVAQAGVVDQPLELEGARVVPGAEGAVVVRRAALDVEQVAGTEAVTADATGDQIEGDIGTKDLVEGATGIAIALALPGAVGEVDDEIVKGLADMSVGRMGVGAAPDGRKGEPRIVDRVARGRAGRPVGVEGIRGAGAVGGIDAVVGVAIGGDVDDQAVEVVPVGRAIDQGTAEQGAVVLELDLTLKDVDLRTRAPADVGVVEAPFTGTELGQAVTAEIDDGGDFRRTIAAQATSDHARAVTAQTGVASQFEVADRAGAGGVAHSTKAIRPHTLNEENLGVVALDVEVTVAQVDRAAGDDGFVADADRTTGGVVALIAQQTALHQHLPLEGVGVVDQHPAQAGIGTRIVDGDGRGARQDARTAGDDATEDHALVVAGVRDRDVERAVEHHRRGDRVVAAVQAHVDLGIGTIVVEHQGAA